MKYRGKSLNEEMYSPHENRYVSGQLTCSTDKEI
jgi:hypothetical protein